MIVMIDIGILGNKSSAYSLIRFMISHDGIGLMALCIV